MRNEGSQFVEEHFRQCLRSQGLRCTSDRLSLFRVLIRAGQPLSRLALVGALQADGIHATTVYRTVEQFTQLGWMQPVMLSDATPGYELQPPFVVHHHHFICTRCGTVTDLPADRVDAVLEGMAAELPGVVHQHQVDLYGTCRKCLEVSGT